MSPELLATQHRTRYFSMSLPSLYANVLRTLNLLTSSVRQHINICFCFITTLHVSTLLGHHQVLPLKHLLLYCKVTFQITLSLT
jgi:hypothetical protein